MDEDIIEDLADAFAGQLKYIEEKFFTHSALKEVVYDSMYAVATVINNHNPTYDLRYFYKRAGFPEPYPIHPIQY
jgi:hypothetical protein